MADKNNIMQQGTGVMIKSATATESVEEEEEEIELGDASAGFLEQFVTTTRNNSANNNEIMDVQEIIGGDVPLNDGNTYIINSETGDIELIQLDEGIGRGEEVEVVTIDANSILGGGGGGHGQGQEQALLQYNAFLDQLKNAAKPKFSRQAKAPSVSIPRLKSAPALLRNSRKILPPAGEDPLGDNSDGHGLIAGNKVSRKQGRSVVASANSGPSGKAFPLSLVGKGTASSKKSAATATTSQMAPNELYFIYQNSEGEQVAQVFNSASPSPSILDPSAINMNVMYQLENSSICIHPTDVANLQFGSQAGKARKFAARKVLTPKKSRPSAVKKDTKSKGGKKGGVSELKCMEKGCSIVTFNILELRKHLTSQHDMTFDSEKMAFPSDAAFKEWREHYERERMVSFIYRGGTKKISKDQAVTYMICHRSGHYKPTMKDESDRKRKMKPQGSCKIGGYCTAGIKLLKNLETGEVNMDICHTHYGHPLDSEAIPHLRVNPVLRKIIQKKFEEGMTFPDMLAYIHHNPDRLEGLRMVDRRAVRNIYDTWKISRPKVVDDVTDPGSEVSCKMEQVVENVDRDKEETNDVKDYEKMANEVPPKADCEPGISSKSQEETESTPTATVDEERIKTTDLSSCHTENSEPSTNDKKMLPQPNSKTEDKSSDEDDDEDAPTLFLADDDEGSEREFVEDNAGPPRLEAIETVTSLKHKNRKRKQARKGKKAKKRRKLPVIVKVETKKVQEKQIDICSPSRHPDTPVDAVDQAEGNNSSQEECDDDDLTILNFQISPQLEATIDKLHDHGESGPTILLYKKVGDINVKYGGFCRAFREDDFCLIIQTPVQRQILQMFPKIINFEILDKSKPNEHDLKLGYLSVLDDYREAIPVAWIVTDSMCPRIFSQLFRTLRYHCGELVVEYIMAPRNVEILKSWTSHFTHKPKMVQNESSARRELRTMLNRHIPNSSVRTKAWSVLEEMIYEKSLKSLADAKERLAKIVKGHPNGSPYLRKMEKDWFSRIEEWSFAHRTRTRCNLLFSSENFLKLKKFVSFKGTKKLNQTMDHILKIGYDKCFLRTKRMFKGDQKFSRLLEVLEKNHKVAKDTMKEVTITSYPAEDFCKWTVEDGEGDDNDTVEVFELKSPCNCKIICKGCSVCMHEYICSCKNFIQEQTMCPHIHKVHCFRKGILMEDEDKPEEMKIEELDTSNDEADVQVLDGSGGLQEAVICEDGTGITFVNENQIEGLNLSEVLQAASGLFSQHEGGSLPKIVSITDADEDKIIYDGEGGGPIIFQFDDD